MDIPENCINADWPRSSIEALITLWNGGKSCGEVARELPGKTRNSVIGKINRLRAQGIALREGADPETMRRTRVGWTGPRPPRTKPPISREAVGIPRAPSKPYLPDAVQPLEIDSTIVLPVRSQRLMQPLPVIKTVKPRRQADDPREPLYWQRIEMIRAALRRHKSGRCA